MPPIQLLDEEEEEEEVVKVEVEVKGVIELDSEEFELSPGGVVVGRSKKGWSPTRTRGRPIGIGRSARLLKGLCGTLSNSSCFSSTKSLYTARDAIIKQTDATSHYLRALWE